MIKVAITGVSGRMGSLLVRMVRESKDLVLVGGTDKPGTASIGLDVGLAARIGPVEVPCLDSLEKSLAHSKPDVVIDFTTPEVSVQHARICAKHKVALVVGSTGFDADAKRHVAESAQQTPIVMSPNMSIGVNLIISVAADLARRLGEDFDIEVLEAHHRHKKDAPSGTAVRLAEELVAATGRSMDVVRSSRVGQIGERPHKEIGVQALRGGDVVGEHTVYFFGDGERVELTHRATNRDQFGRGSLRAARWLVGQQPGVYSMADVLKVS